MKYLISAMLFSFFIIFPQSNNVEEEDITHIQVALLLDTSNSMDGLITQAKSQLWNILNTLSDARKDGDHVRMKIALYHYGNSGNSKYNGYVQQLVPFTSDMDIISEELFRLKTSGGEEYCGEVIYKSLTELDWNEESYLKMMYVAGNESFYQGDRRAAEVLKDCRNQGIVVNTIFCGDYNQGVSLNWKTGADLGLGSYNVINQNEETVYIETPYDNRISELNIELNKTYVAINSKGNKALENMKIQDSNAAVYGSSNIVSRSIFKSKKNYNNASWDLVDSYEKNKDRGYKKADLPQEYRNLTSSEIEEKIKRLSDQRRSIQKDIQLYSKKRSSFIKSQTNDTTSGLEKVITKSVNRQLLAKGFTTGDMVMNDEFKNSIKTVVHYPATTSIDYSGFRALTKEVASYRETRKIGIVDFYNYAAEPNTIILDTRSKQAFDESHLKGAVHLNFSDFTENKLAKVIPSKNSRILIYCNNNFKSKLPSLMLKVAPLALNIPTFINLYGYGYKNLYELNSQLDDSYEGLVINKKGIYNRMSKKIEGHRLKLY